MTFKINHKRSLSMADHVELWAQDRRVESYRRPIKMGTMASAKWKDEPCNYLVQWDDGSRSHVHRFMLIKRPYEIPERDTPAWNIMYQAWIDYALADFEEESKK